MGATQLSFKKTEVGIIPSDWEVSTVGGEFRVELGKMLDTAKNAGTLKQYLGNRAVQWGRIDTEAAGLIRISASELQRYRLRRGDLLVCEGGEIGRAAIWRDQLPECYYQKALHRLRPRHGFNVELMMAFLQHWAAAGYLSNYATQTSIAHLPKEKLEQVPLPVPKHDEQRAISAVLSDVDALIDALDKLIAKKREIRFATIQEIFGLKLCLKSFVRDWVKMKLGTVCRSIVDGTHFTPRYVHDGIPFYSVENVTGDNFANTKFISPEEHLSLVNRCRPERGDILLTRIGSIGITKLIDWDVNASIYVSLALLKVRSDIDSAYLYCYTKTKQFIEDIEARSLRHAYPQKINMNQIGEVPIPVPSLQAQCAISAVIRCMDAEIAALERRRDKTKAIKLGMMQALLTGRIRLCQVEPQPEPVA